MRSTIFAAGLFVLGTLTAAHAEPAYYRVSGVSAHDVLNIRAEPTVNAPIVGTLPPGASPVEVLETSGNWARLSTGEGPGWVSLRFLQEISVATLPGTHLPEGLVCVGAEPFYDIALNGAAIRHRHPDNEAGIVYAPARSGTTAARLGRYFVEGERNGGAGRMSMIVRSEACTDGMSDRDYGWSLDAIIVGDGEPYALEGCCFLPMQ